MVFKNKILSLLFLSTFLITMFCNICYADSSKEGYYNGSTYHNDYLGFYIQLPSDWQKVNNLQKQELDKKAADVYSGGDTNLKNQMTESINSALTLLNSTKYPLGAPNNISIIIAATNVENFPYLQNSNNHLEATKRFLLNTNMKIEIEKDIHEEEINGEKYASMTVNTKLGKLVIRQKIYSVIRKEYAVLCVLSYALPNQEQEVDTIFSSLHFNK